MLNNIWLMIEQINNFANFNLAAILFAVIGSGVFLTVVVLVSIVAMTFKMNFNESFPLTFVFLLFLGLIS